MIMIKLIILILLNVILGLVNSQQIENKINGHKYQLFTSASVNWFAADALATQAGGYLATITTQQEAQFIEDNFLQNSPFVWIGGHSNNSYGDGSIYQWETGPEKGLQIYNRRINKCLSYCRWLPGQPDTDPFKNSTEAYMHYWTSKYWNDVPYNWASITGYIVEWGGETDPFIKPTDSESGTITIMNMLGFTMKNVVVVFENSTVGNPPFICQQQSTTATTLTCVTPSTNGIYDIRISDGLKSFHFKQYTVNQPSATSVVLPNQLTQGSQITVNGLSFGEVSSAISFNFSSKATPCTNIKITVPHRSFVCTLSSTILSDWNIVDITNNLQHISISVSGVLRLNQTRVPFYYNSKLIGWSGNAQSVSLMNDYFISEGLGSYVFSPVVSSDYSFLRNMYPQNIVLPVTRTATGYNFVNGPYAGKTLISLPSLTCNSAYLPDCGVVNTSVSTASPYTNLILNYIDKSINIGLTGTQFVAYNVPTLKPIFMTSSSWVLPTAGGWIQLMVSNMILTSSQYQVLWGGNAISATIIPFTNNQTIGLFVPPGTGASKPLTVSVEGQVSTATPSNTLAFLPPSITNVTRASTNGGYIVVNGTNLGNNAAVVTATISTSDNSIAPYTVPANLIITNHTTIQFTVTPGYGTRNIKITVDGQDSNTIVLLYANPTVQSSSQNGRVVTLQVSDVGNDKSLISVEYDGKLIQSSDISIPAIGQVQFTPPADSIASSSIMITYNSLRMVTPYPLQLVPVLLSTQNVNRGEPIIVSGYYLSNVTKATFGTYTISPVSVVNNQQVSIPTSSLTQFSALRVNLNLTSLFGGVSNNLIFSFGPIITIGSSDYNLPSTVSISGYNFDTDSIVTINQDLYTPQYLSPTNLLIKNLANETTIGYISVTSSGLSSTPLVFIMFPIVTSVSPLQSPTNGTRITIQGYYLNFKDANNTNTTVTASFGSYGCLNPTPGINNQIMYCDLVAGIGANLRLSLSIATLPSAQTFRISYQLPLIDSVIQDPSRPNMITINGNNFGTSNSTSDLNVQLSGVKLSPCIIINNHVSIQCQLDDASTSGPLSITVKSQTILQPYQLSLHPLLSSISNQSSNGGIITIKGKYLNITTNTNTIVKIDNQECLETKNVNGIVTCNVTEEQASGSISPMIKVYINDSESFNSLPYQYNEPVYSTQQLNDQIELNGINLGGNGPTVYLGKELLSCQYKSIHTRIECQLTNQSLNGLIYLLVNQYNVSLAFKLTPNISSIEPTPTIGGDTIIVGKYLNNLPLQVFIGSSICKLLTPLAFDQIKCQTSNDIPSNSLVKVTNDGVESNTIVFNYLGPVIQHVNHTDLTTIQIFGVNFGSSSINSIKVQVTGAWVSCYNSIESPIVCNISTTQLNGPIQLIRDQFSSNLSPLSLYPWINQVSSIGTRGGNITIYGNYLNQERYNGSLTNIQVKVGQLDCSNIIGQGTLLICLLPSGSGSNLPVSVLIDDLSSRGEVYFNFGLPNINMATQTDNETIVLDVENAGNDINTINVTLSNQLLQCNITIDSVQLACRLEKNNSGDGDLILKVNSQLSSAYPISLHSILQTITPQSSTGGLVIIDGYYLGIQTSTNLTITINPNPTDFYSNSLPCQNPQPYQNNQVSCIVEKDQVSFYDAVPTIDVWINGYKSYNSIMYKYSQPIIENVEQIGNQLFINGSSLGSNSIEVTLGQELLVCQVLTFHQLIVCNLTNESINGILEYQVNGYSVNVSVSLLPSISTISSVDTIGGESIINGIFLGSFIVGRDSILINGSTMCSGPKVISNNQLSCQIVGDIVMDHSLVQVVIDGKETNKIEFNYLPPTITSINSNGSDIIYIVGTNFGINDNDFIKVQDDNKDYFCSRIDDKMISCKISMNQQNGFIQVERNQIVSSIGQLLLKPLIETISMVSVMGGSLEFSGNFLNLYRSNGTNTTISILTNNAGPCKLLNVTDNRSMVCEIGVGSKGKDNDLVIEIDGQQSNTIQYSAQQPTIQQSTSVPYGKGGQITLYGSEFVDPINWITIGEKNCTLPTLVTLGSVITCQFDGSANPGDSQTGLPVQVDCAGLSSPIANVFLYSDDQDCPLCSPNGGYCQSGICQCNPGYYGVYCNVTTIDPPILPNITVVGSGSFNGSDYTVTLTHIREVDLNGLLISSIPISLIYWNQSIDDNNNIFIGKFIQDQEEEKIQENFTIKIINTISKEDGTSILFAGESIILSKNTLKHQIELNGWKFNGSGNRLQLVYDLKSPLQSQVFEDDCGGTTTFNVTKSYQHDDSNDIRWVSLGVGNSNFIGRFSNRYIVDNGTVLVGRTNILAQSDTIFQDPYYLEQSITFESTNHFVVAMNVPLFVSNSLVDPTFSLVVDKSFKGPSCEISGGSSKKSLWWISLVAIGGVGIAGASGFFAYKYWKKKSIEKQTNVRLNELRKNNV